MWLFGQLDTLEESTLQQRTDENARVVAGLLQQLLDGQQEAGGVGGEADGMAKGDMQAETSS